MTFALITEGISEHNIIKYILQKYFKEDDPDINQIQPKISGSKQITIGGWNEVLSYCTRATELQNIFADNDYLVIQIDTDQSQIAPFSVSHTTFGSKTKMIDELHTDVVIKLITLIPPAILKTYSQRIFVAICVHTIECWLLPIYYINNQKSSVTNCLFKLNSELGKKSIHIIPSTAKNSANSIRTYDEVLRNWKRKQDIEAASQHNAGFKRFIESISTIK